jgi:ABC-type proline/glycine betaine transport system ATPase subunit
MVTHLVEDALERADRALLLDRDHQVGVETAASEMHATPAFQHVYGRFVARHDTHRQGAEGPG